jgi:hypothetical protein
MKSIIKINIDNTMENININEKLNLEEELMKNTKFKGYKNIKELYTWNKKKIRAYGWITGSNYINIHKLPPCGITNNLELSEDAELYGNIFIVSFHNNNIINYNISKYGELHYILTDDLKEYSNSENEDDDEDIPDKKQQIHKMKNTIEYVSYNDLLLDEDLNEYN